MTRKSNLITQLFILVFLSCSAQEEQINIFQVPELGFSIGLPKNTELDFLKGGTVSFIRDTTSNVIGGVVRQPASSNKLKFIYEAQTITDFEKMPILNINKDSTYVQASEGKRKYFFRLIRSEFYEFYCWSKMDDLLNKMTEGFIIDSIKLSNDYENGIDYKVEGNDTLNFLRDSDTLLVGQNNFFSINISHKQDEKISMQSAGSRIIMRTPTYFNIIPMSNNNHLIDIVVAIESQDGTRRIYSSKTYHLK